MELKIVRASEFTSKHIEPSGDNDQDYLKNRMLIGATGFIGKGFHYLDAH